MLMSKYQQSIEDGIITVNEAKRLLKKRHCYNRS